MKLNSLELKGAYELEPRLFTDKRGYFFEWFNKQKFKNETGLDFNPVQFNCSKSSKGVLRGLHFQYSSHAQAKLITATRGEIQDVIVDLRNGSPTFGAHYSTILTEQNKKQIYIPKGFAHGFLVLSDEAEIFYAIDNFYAPDHEGGVAYNDPEINVSWQLKETQIILSEKDKTYGALGKTPLNFKI